MRDREAFAHLGLRSDATPAQIRGAFRRMVRKYHPDTATGDLDDAALLEVIEAYRRLIDPPVGDHDAAAAKSEPRSGGCSTCLGAGRVRTVASCPPCDGRGEIVLLNAGGARWFRCPACRGRGRILQTRPCPVCDDDQV